jgi:hypothetical protein
MGLNQEQLKLLEQLRCSNTTILKLPDLPEYMRPSSSKKQYGWKGTIFKNTCEDKGGIVVWLDSIFRISNPKARNNIIDKTTKLGIYTPPRLDDPIKHWTHDTCINYMQNYYNEHLDIDSNIRKAGMLSCNYDEPWVKKFVNDWSYFCTVPETILSQSNERTHRHDMSVLSILYYKYMKAYHGDNLQQIDKPPYGINVGWAPGELYQKCKRTW